jgi:hypothetical protein
VYVDYTGMAHRDDITAHIENLDSAQTRRLTSRIARACWPGGPADRTEPSALQWVRLWRPHHGRQSGLTPCACATGRCLVCN